MVEVYDSHLHMGMLSDNCIVHPQEVLSFISKYHVKGGVINFHHYSLFRAK